MPRGDQLDETVPIFTAVTAFSGRCIGVQVPVQHPVAAGEPGVIRWARTGRARWLSRIASRRGAAMASGFFERQGDVAAGVLTWPTSARRPRGQRHAVGFGDLVLMATLDPAGDQGRQHPENDGPEGSGRVGLGCAAGMTARTGCCAAPSPAAGTLPAGTLPAGTLPSGTWSAGRGHRLLGIWTAPTSGARRGGKLAWLRAAGRAPAVVFLPVIAATRGRRRRGVLPARARPGDAAVRFGHGASDGAFEDGTIGACYAGGDRCVDRIRWCWWGSSMGG